MSVVLNAGWLFYERYLTVERGEGITRKLCALRSSPTVLRARTPVFFFPRCLSFKIEAVWTLKYIKDCFFFIITSWCFFTVLLFIVSCRPSRHLLNEFQFRPIFGRTYKEPFFDHIIFPRARQLNCGRISYPDQKLNLYRSTAFVDFAYHNNSKLCVQSDLTKMFNEERGDW